MNTRLYKQIYSLAGELMEAAETGDDAQFDLLYQQLKKLCYDNEANEHCNHPVQWETLADFTQDSREALAKYEKALVCAKAIGATDYMASISYAIALLLTENPALDANGDKTLTTAKNASEYAANTTDSELQKEIADLLKRLNN